MVIVSAMFVVGEDEERLRPFRTIEEGVVDVVNELLTRRDIADRMLTVAGLAPARFEEDEGS
jgi:hypothetical protein